MGWRRGHRRSSHRNEGRHSGMRKRRHRGGKRSEPSSSRLTAAWFFGNLNWIALGLALAVCGTAGWIVYTQRDIFFPAGPADPLDIPATKPVRFEPKIPEIPVQTGTRPRLEQSPPLMDDPEWKVPATAPLSSPPVRETKPESTDSAPARTVRMLRREELAQRVQLALEAMKIESNDHALRLLREVEQADPTFPQIHMYLAVLLHNMERMEEALASVRRERASDASSAPAAHLEAILLSALDRYEEANGVFGQARELDPDSPLIPLNWSLTLRRMGRYQEAIQLLEAALEKTNARPEARLLLALARIQAGELDKAQSGWSGSEAEDSGQSLMVKGAAELFKGNTAAGVELLQAARKQLTKAEFQRLIRDPYFQSKAEEPWMVELRSER